MQMWRHLIAFDAAAALNIPLRADGGTNRPLIFSHGAQDLASLDPSQAKVGSEM